MRIAVAYDAAAAGDAPTTAPDTAGVLEAVRAVVDVLTAAGHAAFPVAAARPPGRLLNRLGQVDVIVNLVESLGGRAEDEPRAAALLELAGPSVTGSPSDVLALCRRKDLVNTLLDAGGLPVPVWASAARVLRDGWSAFPAIVKPVGEDGSVGITETSVVEDALELAGALERAGGDVLVQRFVGGRELNVGIVGGVVLPVAEIAFSGRQRVVSYAAKWHAGSSADRMTRPVCPAVIPEPTRREAVAVAAEAWRLVGGRGYGRVDLRMDELGRVHVLEVNPNPDLAPSAGLARMAAAHGWEYADLVQAILAEAVQ